MRRIRRPLLALLILVAALAIGYGVKAARADVPSLPGVVPTMQHT